MQIVRWRKFADAGALTQAAVDEITRAAQAAIAARGVFHLVLAGGRTPLAAYSQLEAPEQDWGRWHIYFGDERCYPAGHAQRNDAAILAAWLDRVVMPTDQIHRIPAELGAQQAAERYIEVLKAVGDFDLVLLGLGEDGHTASLFPGQPLGDTHDSPDALAVHDAPKPPRERVSMSAARLSRARQVLFLVTGRDKRAALAAWRRGEELPARHIVPTGGVDVYVDGEADAAV